MEDSKPAVLAANVQSFTFHGAELEVVHDGSDVWVSIRRVCDSLGLQPHGQLAKLKGKPWATKVIITSVGADGKKRPIAMIHLDSLPMWLATIEPSRVAAEVRPRLEVFQVEAARALRDHFLGRPAAAAQPDESSAQRAVEALTTKVTTFDFQGSELEVAQTGPDVWVSVRRICEGLSLDFSSQLDVLRSRAWAGVIYINTPSAVRGQGTAMLHLEALPMWLATIDPTDAGSAAARHRVGLFQQLCARTIRERFLGRPAPTPRLDASLPESAIAFDPIAEDEPLPDAVAKQRALRAQCHELLRQAGLAAVPIWAQDFSTYRSELYGTLARLMHWLAAELEAVDSTGSSHKLHGDLHLMLSCLIRHSNDRRPKPAEAPKRRRPAQQSKLPLAG